MRKLIVLLCCVASLAFTACNDGPSKEDSKTETPDNAETTADELVGTWERHNADAFYILSLKSDGTGKLVYHENAASNTEPFRYTVTGNSIVVEYGKFKKQTYTASLTRDGKYLVFDDGSSVYVYKKRGK